MTKIYPKGHPQIIRENFDYSLKSYFGLIKCKIQPPNNLYHPVLPRKYKITDTDKLIFDLGGKNNEPFIGTWTHVEINKALEKGYKILEIYEVHHFKETTDNIFKSYIGRYYEIKENADKPESKNPPLKALAKLVINNLWGRFGMRTFKDESVFIRCYNEVLSLFKKVDKNIIQEDSVNVDCINEEKDIWIANYKLNDEFMDDKFDTNLYIASYTTSYARLRLYEAMELVGENCLYYDTDSIIYVVKDNIDPLEKLTGSKIGELKDELDGAYIDEFVSGGPKNYSYKLIKDDKVKYEVKVKGITLNFDTKKDINFESVKNMIINFITDKNNYKEIKVKNTRFILNKQYNIETNDEYQKTYQFNYDKRQIYYYNSNMIETLPYGHKDLDK